MKILEFFREKIRFAFIRVEISTFPSRNVFHKYPVSLKHLFPLIVSIICVILLITSLFRDEFNTFEEYSDIVYSLATNVLNIVIFLSIFTKRAEIYEFIDMLEAEFTKRKLTHPCSDLLDDTSVEFFKVQTIQHRR